MHRRGKYGRRKNTAVTGIATRILTSVLLGTASAFYINGTGCTTAFSVWFGLTAGTVVFAGLKAMSLVASRLFGKKESAVPLHVALLIILILLLLFIIWYLLFMYVEPAPVVITENVEEDPILYVTVDGMAQETSEPPVQDAAASGSVRIIEDPEPEPKLPQTPQFINVTRELMNVPDKVPETVETETYEDPYEEFDDSFWDDWFVSGEDEIVLDDGVVTMELHINGILTGYIDVIIEDAVALLPTEQVKAYLVGSLTEEAVNRLYDEEVSEYMTPDDYIGRGVPTTVDLMASVVYMDFSVADMPWRTISIKGKGTKKTVMPEDAQAVRRAFLTAKASFSPALTFMNGEWSINTGIGIEFGIGYLKGRLSGWMAGSRLNPFSIGFNGLSASFEIPDALMKISFGSVQTGLISSYGKHVGVIAETSPAYAREGWTSPSSHYMEIVIEEDSVIEVTNDGKTIYKRSLRPGNYRLEDLILVEGLNDIDVKVTPVSGNTAPGAATIIKYSPVLLAKGETYWRAGVDAGFDDSWLDAPSKYIVSGAVRTGVTKTFTLDADVAVAVRPDGDGIVEAKSVFGGAIATSGAPVNTSLSLNFKDFSDPRTFSMQLQASGRFDLDSSLIKSVGWSLAWQEEGCLDSCTLSGKVNASGSLGPVGWSLSAGGSLNPAKNDLTSVNASLRLTYAPVKNLTLSASAMIYADATGKTDFQCRVGGSLSAGGLSMSADNASDGGSTNVSWSKENVSVQSSWRGEWKDFLDPELHTLSLSGGVGVFGFPVNGSLSTNGKGTLLAGGLSTSFSMLFADGLFAVMPSAPERILLVRQDGALKGNGLGIASPNSTEMSVPHSTFGTYYNTGIPSTATPLLLSSDPKDGIGTSSIQTVAIPEEKWGTYIFRMTESATYSVTGVLTDSDGEPLEEGAFLLHTWKENDDGEMELVPTDRYLFTDGSGRFVADGLEPGSYAFETNEGGRWSLREFEVDDGWNHRKCTVLEEKTGDPVDDYDMCYIYTYKGSVDMDTLFEMLYGKEAI